MCRKLIRNEGSASVIIAMMLPMIMAVIFFGVDFINYYSNKTSLQRKLDSATLGIVIKAAPDEEDNEYVTVQREIISVKNGTKEDKGKACELKKEYFTQAYDQLADDTNELYSLNENEMAEYSSFSVVFVSTDNEMEAGIARIGVIRYMDNFMVNYLLPVNMKLPMYVESYAVCTY